MRGRRHVSCAVIVALVSVATLAGQSTPPSSEPTLAIVLDRAAAYVDRYHERLARVVAEEHYVQDWYSTEDNERRLRQHRELRSDLVLMQVGQDMSWTEFRDVFEVDGHAIRPRDRRLEDLLRQATDLEEASAMVAEGARFNIGDVDRNVNTPLFALRFLEAGNRRRFTFSRAKSAARSGPAAGVDTDRVFRVSTEVWEIAYRETQKPTLIRTARRRNQPVSGRFWIEPETGRVLVSELKADDRDVRATIEVSFQSEPLLDMLVPVAMRERYEATPARSVLEGRATYGTFRLLPR